MIPQPKSLREMTLAMLKARRLEMVDIVDTLEVVHVSELPHERRIEHAASMRQTRTLLTAIEGEITRRMAVAIAQRAQAILLPEQEQPEEIVKESSEHREER